MENWILHVAKQDNERYEKLKVKGMKMDQQDIFNVLMLILICVLIFSR